MAEIDVKKIMIKPIRSKIANDFVRKWHYSGKVTSNSQLHFGAFYDGILHGVMSFGPSLDKSKIIGLVKDTAWNDFLELNRMAFDSFLPKNSESRSISVAMRLIKKTYPNIEWVVSFADGTQCGDGTIYRASGFVLTMIKENSDCMKTESGTVIHTMTVKSSKQLMSKYGNWKTAMRETYGEYSPLKGFQLRYLYFLNKDARSRLTVPILPFSAIDKMGAGMYLGIKRTSGGSVTVAQPAIQQERGGSIPTSSQITEL